MNLARIQFGGAYGRKIKLTMSLWFDYILAHGSDETHLRNAIQLLWMIEHMSNVTDPYFSVMNTELHIDIDKSLGLLLEGKLPEGNDFAIVGPTHVDKIDFNALKASGYPYRTLSGGSVAIQFTDRWGGKNAL